MANTLHKELGVPEEFIDDLYACFGVATVKQWARDFRRQEAYEHRDRTKANSERARLRALKNMRKGKDSKFAALAYLKFRAYRQSSGEGHRTTTSYNGGAGGSGKVQKMA